MESQRSFQGAASEKVMHVSKCLKCKTEIDFANYVESGLICYVKGEWLKDDSADIEYTCPECGEKNKSQLNSLGGIW